MYSVGIMIWNQNPSTAFGTIFFFLILKYTQTYRKVVSIVQGYLLPEPFESNYCSDALPSQHTPIKPHYYHQNRGNLHWFITSTQPTNPIQISSVISIKIHGKKKRSSLESSSAFSCDVSLVSFSLE